MGSDYSPREVAERIADPETQLIDVRETDEHAAGRIAGGRLIELGRLSDEAAAIDRERPVIFYCRSGARSAMAAEAFAQAGYDAHNMTGGLFDGLRSSPRTGRA